MIELCPSRYAAMFPKRKEQASATAAGPFLSAPIDVLLPVQQHVGSTQDVRALDGAEDALVRREQLKREAELMRSTQTVDRVLRGVYSMLRRAGMTPGCDFVAAVDAARCVGARIVLGDRDAFTTMEQVCRVCKILLTIG